MDQNDLNFKELDTEIQNILDQSEYRNFLKMQIEEIEILQAMYYKQREFRINNDILQLANSYLKGDTLELPPTFDFLVNVNLEGLSLEVQVVLPKLYPTVQPKIFIRSKQLASNQVITLNDDLKLFLKSIDKGSICVLECILWTINNIQKYRETKTSNTTLEDVEEKFSRYWIYSHHIYSKEKRKHIMSLSKELNLTGFCLSGKPGIICVEGRDSDCSEWWHQVKNLTWKKIVCIEIEKLSIPVSDCEAQRKFDGFNEVSFQSIKSNKTDVHADMGEFYKYLMNHRCGYIFKEYFGFEGKVSSLD